MASTHITRTQIDVGGRATPLVARVNRRAKRLILRVDPVLGEIQVTAPSQRAIPEAIAFARERERWLVGQLDETLRARPFAEGATAPFRGVEHSLRREGGPRAPVRVKAEGADGALPALVVGGDSAHLNRRLTDWMKRQARRELESAVETYAREVGRRPRAIKIRDTRTRWGSCSSDATMSFSWRLIMAPPEILSYVAAHECAHLVHMNHSPAFWRLVLSLGADARAAERWFERNGARLFTYGGSARA